MICGNPINILEDFITQRNLSGDSSIGSLNSFGSSSGGSSPWHTSPTTAASATKTPTSSPTSIVGGRGTITPPSLLLLSQAALRLPPLLPQESPPAPTPDCFASAIFIQQNGRKVYGPPCDWQGPEPDKNCELFVKRIPKTINEDYLFDCFVKFGKIYCFRLLMEYNNSNRGYAYVCYENAMAAELAMTVLNHFFIQTGKRLHIEKSYEKSRFFVGNIPKQLSPNEIENTLREIFPDLKKCIVYSAKKTFEQNRGYAFIDFPSHQIALEAKKLISTSRCQIWDRDVRIVWATQEKNCFHYNLSDEKSTLFVRNIDEGIDRHMFLNVMKRYFNLEKIKNCIRFRECAFIEFFSRACASVVLQVLQAQDIVLNGKNLIFAWANTTIDSNLDLKNKDFDAVLRIKCIANDWNPPIYIFGRHYPEYNRQYVAVIIKATNSKKCSTFYIEMSTCNLTDIQSRVAETVCMIIERDGYLYDSEYVLVVQTDVIHLIGCIIRTLPMNESVFISSNRIPDDLSISLTDIIDLSKVTAPLMTISFDNLYHDYLNTLKFSKLNANGNGNGTGNNCSFNVYLPNAYTIHNQQLLLGCINYEYRKRLPLPYSLDNRQIVLVMCDRFTGGTNFIPPHPIMFTHLKLIQQQEFNNDHLPTIKYRRFHLNKCNLVQWTILQDNELIFNSIRFDRYL